MFINTENVKGLVLILEFLCGFLLILGDEVMQKKKILIILGIILGASLILGTQYAAYRWAYNPSDLIEGPSDCLFIEYQKGNDIGSNENSETLIVTDDYRFGLSSTASIKVKDGCTISGNGTLYLTTDDSTSDILLTSGVLNYKVLVDSTSVSSGNITSKGPIIIYDNFTINNTEQKITVYVWISGEFVTYDNIEEITSSLYKGSIGVKVRGL